MRIYKQQRQPSINQRYIKLPAMFTTFLNRHAIKNQILIIVLEGILRHKQTHKNNSFGFFKTIFQIFMKYSDFYVKTH